MIESYSQKIEGVTSINIEVILKKMREEEDRYWTEDKILEEKEELLEDKIYYE